MKNTLILAFVCLAAPFVFGSILVAAAPSENHVALTATIAPAKTQAPLIQVVQVAQSTPTLATPTTAPTTPAPTATSTARPSATPWPSQTAQPTADATKFWAEVTQTVVMQDLEKRQFEIDKEYYINLGVFVLAMVGMVVGCAFAMFLILNWAVDSTRRWVASFKFWKPAQDAPARSHTPQDERKSEDDTFPCPLAPEGVEKFKRDYKLVKSLAHSAWKMHPLFVDDNDTLRAWLVWLDQKKYSVKVPPHNERMLTAAGSVWFGMEPPPLP